VCTKNAITHQGQGNATGPSFLVWLFFHPFSRIVDFHWGGAAGIFALSNFVKAWPNCFSENKRQRKDGHRPGETYNELI